MICRVKVGFYRYDHKMYAKWNNTWKKLWIFLIRLFTRSNYTHCSIEFLNEGTSTTLVALVGMDATFAPTETVDNFLGKPDVLVSLGELEVDDAGIDKIISGLYQGSVSKVLLWFFVTRWLGFSKPKTCSTLVCELLSKCGYNIKTNLSPGGLYREVVK